jgi:hypothetical protein
VAESLDSHSDLRSDLPILAQGLSAILLEDLSAFFLADLPAVLFIRRPSGGLADLTPNSHCFQKAPSIQGKEGALFTIP